MNKNSRKAALALAGVMDGVANDIQRRAALFGISPKIAQDFAYRSDLLADAIELAASAEFSPDEIGEAEPVDSADPAPAFMDTFAEDSNDVVHEVAPKVAARRKRLASLLDTVATHLQANKDLGLSAKQARKLAFQIDAIADQFDSGGNEVAAEIGESAPVEEVGDAAPFMGTFGEDSYDVVQEVAPVIASRR